MPCGCLSTVSSDSAANVSRVEDGALRIAVKLTDRNRFLSLVATDGGDGNCCDWDIFGDPVLELETAE